MNTTFLNKYRIDKAFLTKLRKDMRSKKKTKFIEKYNPKIVGDNVKVAGKSLIALERVPKMLQEMIDKTGVPLGIRSLQHIIQERMFGITRSMITNFLQDNPILQEIRTRPGTRTIDRSQLKNEGSTDFILKKYPNTLGIDLIELTRDSIPDNLVPKKYKTKGGKTYILICVHKRTGFLWGTPIVDKEAKTVVKAFKPMRSSCAKKFGVNKHVETDAGLEFRGEMTDYLRRSRVHRKILRLVPYVERANSTFQRYLIFLAATGPKKTGLKTYEAHIQRAVQKFRNIKSRVIGKTTASIKNESLPKAYVRGERKHKKWQGGRHKKPKFKIGDNVKYLKKFADRDKSGFYRSYVGALKKKKWSAVTKVIKTHGDKYQLTDGSWRQYTDLLKQRVKPKVQKGFPKYKVRGKPKQGYQGGRQAQAALKRKNKRKKVAPNVRGRN